MSSGKAAPHRVVAGASRRASSGHPTGRPAGLLTPAVLESVRAGLRVAQVHIRHLHPLPKNLGALLAQFETVLVPELNTGQLSTLLRDKLLVPVQQLNKVTGQPFTVQEVRAAIARHARAVARKARSARDRADPRAPIRGSR